MLFKEPKIEPAFENYKEIFDRAVEEAIEDLKENNYHLGEGRTAEVKSSNIKDFICLKTIDYQKTRQERITLHNRAKDEMQFLDKLSDVNFLKSLGITRRIVPRPMYATDAGNLGFLFMQKIGGLTIEDWKRADSKPELLPPDFNWPDFFADLEDIVKKINSAKIFHRDLHEGNIFIDERGRPMIIDFGNAYESVLSDEDPYKEEDFSGNITAYISDWQRVQNIKTSIVNNLS